MLGLPRPLAPLVAVVATFAIAPAVASAATCDLPSQVEPGFTPALDVEGDIAASRAGGYLQLPFTVPAGTTAIRVRYSYDQPGSTCNTPPSPAPSNTLDIGVYGPRDAGDPFWGIDESRGWSGSAVRDLAIAENGFSGEAIYEADPKALVRGATTRAYRPGPIPSGEWAVELGLAFIAEDVDGIHYRVLVETTSSPDWANAPYTPAGYSAAPVVKSADWYSGDLHVHGEQEPGNATITATLASAFGPSGAGLDFITLVDHNNNVGHDNLAGYQAANPDKLIIPGTEVTTYRGHLNNQGKGPFVDFRGGPILAPGPGVPLNANVPDSGLQQVRGGLPPSGSFAEITGEGNWSQINHPETFRATPSFCRGCAWGYDDAETDYSKVDAIEVQTGPAGVPQGMPAAPNPFTSAAIAFYERALGTGAHIAAVGSSDDHRGASGTGPFDSPVGSATTVVHATELSERAITEGVKGDHTYVKFFGTDGPDISLTAKVPGAPQAIIGDSITGPSAELEASVTGAADTGRPGAFSLILLQDGIAIERVPFSGNSFKRTFTAGDTGRYSLEVARAQLGQDYVEVYSSPIWFSRGGTPSSDFRITGVKRNKRRGTATLTARVPGPGELVLGGKSLVRTERVARDASEVRLKVKAKGRLKRRVGRRGAAKARIRVSYVPTGGEGSTERRKLTLRKRR